jgi:uncharacterized membrane protein
MADRPVTPVIIGGIVGIFSVVVGAIYYWVLSELPGGRIVGLVILVGTIAVVAAIVYVVYQRMREIEKENPDDYRKY